MFITRVELRNIKNHAESSYTFQPGVISICGPNGSGKTTILEAIAWTLFDYLDYKRDDFVRRGARKGQATVGFVSDLDDREYLVTRDTGGTWFVYDPQTRARLVEQKSQVLPWLRQRLGVEPGTDLSVLYRTTIGVPQGTFTFDFSLPPANRKATFDQILRVEEYRQAADQLRVPQRLAEGRKIELEKQLSRQEGELAIGDELEGDYAVALDRLSGLADALEAARADRERLAVTLRHYDGLRDVLEERRRAVLQSQAELGRLKERYQAAEQACRQAREASRVVIGAAEGYRLYLEATARLEQLEVERAERDRLRIELGGHEQRLVEAEGVERYSGERLAEIARARLEAGPLEPLVAQQQELELQLQRLREGRGEALSLQLTHADLRQELDKLRGRYQALTGQIEEAQRGQEAAASISALETEREMVEAESQQLGIVRESRQLKLAQLERLQREQQQRYLEEERLRQELQCLEKDAETAASVVTLEARQQELAGRQARLAAEIARDSEMIAALDAGGICPLLTERCLNLKEGESIETRFQAGIDQRRSGIDSIGRDLEPLNRALGEARRAAHDYARLPELQRNLESMVGNNLEFSRQIDLLRGELEQIPSDLERLVSQLVERRSRNEEALRAAREAQRLIHQADVLGEERTRIQREGEVRRAEFDRLAARLAELGDVDRQIEEQQQRLGALGDPRSRLLALRQTIDRESEWQADAKRAGEAAATIRQQVEPLRRQILSTQHLDHELASATEARSRHQPDYLAYIGSQQMAETLDRREVELRSLADQKATLQNDLDSVNKGLAESEAEYDQVKHQQCRDDYDRCRELVAQLDAQQQQLSSQVETIARRLAALAAIRDEMRVLVAERDSLASLGRKTEMIRETLVKAAPFITEAYLYSISHEANQLYREITGRYDITLRWTKDYEILIEEDGYERPFTNLSGGEQMAAALAVRLALLRELSEINLAIFDEPTTNMDEERRRNLALQLGRINDFHQLFVISHDDSFEGLTDQQINLGQSS